MRENPTRRAEAALERLTALYPKLIDLGLERSFSLLARLGNPHLRMPPVLHLAGTNGKGSTLAFLRAMAEAAGLRVHAYTSPHLVRFNERIRLGGNLIGDTALADMLEEVEAANGGEAATFFEMTTAAAMLAFARHGADLTLLETGLGGRLDATNVLEGHLAAVITPIAHDHEHFLGTTLAAIAGEKAGIMRPRRPVLVASQPREVMAALQTHAASIGAELLREGDAFTITLHGRGVRVACGGRAVHLPQPRLMGAHQKYNAGLAAATLMRVRPEITDAALACGVVEARWPGRVHYLGGGEARGETGGGHLGGGGGFVESGGGHLGGGRLADLLPPGVPLWLDGAHNGHGAAALCRCLGEISKTPWVLICGALNTRPPQDFLAPLAPRVSHAIALTIPGQAAAMAAEEIAAAARGVGLTAETAASLGDALQKAAPRAVANGGGVIISGSLYLAGHVLAENETPLD